MNTAYSMNMLIAEIARLKQDFLSISESAGDDNLLQSQFTSVNVDSFDWMIVFLPSGKHKRLGGYRSVKGKNSDAMELVSESTENSGDGIYWMKFTVGDSWSDGFSQELPEQTEASQVFPLATISGVTVKYHERSIRAFDWETC